MEDPIERVIQGINQTQVYAEKGLGYADILPKLLRQDPDVVMIGEIRDEQTADVALTAAITGSLVLSTVHAGGVFEVFTRLRQLGTKADLLAASLRLIVSQRLIGTNCTDCIEQEAVSPTVCSMFKLEPHTRLSSSRGCEHCGFSGVGGRRGFFELLPLHGGLRKILYRAGANASSCLPIDDLMKESMRQGFRPLALMVREALLSGEISAAAALKALGLAADVVFSNK